MDKTKKKNVRRYILWGVLAVVVAGLALLPALARQQDAQDGPVASVLEAEVKEGSVQATVRGGGTLEAGDGEDIELPADVKITEFLVKNGQEVKKGDPVAKIDKVSALTVVFLFFSVKEIRLVNTVFCAKVGSCCRNKRNTLVCRAEHCVKIRSACIFYKF